jgi:V/A-type H+-transporting ATPase subunit D
MAKILNVNPTRMELIKLKRKIKLTEKGRKLMKEKRDALIMKFLEIIKKSGESREEFEAHFAETYKSLIKAQALAGTLDVKSAAMAVKSIDNIELEIQSLVGIKVPQIKVPETKRNLSNRGYSPIGVSMTVDEAAQKFEQALKLILELAEVEKSIQLLAGEVERTKRRVNALEYIILPRQRNTTQFIEMRLNEMEREDFSRLKKIKSKLEKKAQLKEVY